jgi:hypothetical protein
MNIVLKRPDDSEYYVVYVMESMQGGYLCVAKRVAPGGELVEQCEQFGPYFTEEQAIKRCRIRAKVKVRRRGYVMVPLEEIPEELGRWLEVSDEMKESPDTLIAMAKEAKTERYVVFSNVAGISDLFDLGIEYLAHDIGGGLLSVYDRYGKEQQCFVERMDSISPTERSVEIAKVFDGE